MKNMVSQDTVWTASQDIKVRVGKSQRLCALISPSPDGRQNLPRVKLPSPRVQPPTPFPGPREGGEDSLAPKR
jgi:hypothetical protein